MTVSEQVIRTEPVKQIASKIVNECLKVKTDEQVNIFSFPHTLDYANALALEVEKAGGVSTMLLETDEFFWSYLSTEIPEAQYSRKQRAFLSMLEETDAQIGLGGPKDPAGFSKASAERINKMMEGEREVGDRTRELKIRYLSLPVGLVTPERAKTYGFDYNQWRTGFTRAINVDHGKVVALGRAIAQKLEKAENVRVTTADGTDVRFRLAGRRVRVHDGVLDESDLSTGTLNAELPSGAVEVAPEEAMVEGKIVFDQPTALRGKMLQGLQWTFKDGRLSSYNAVANLDAFKGLYENATGDKDRLASFTIGLNPAAELFGFYQDRIVLGTVSLGIGGNRDLDGANESQFGHQQTLRKPTVELDGQKLVIDGRIQA